MKVGIPGRKYKLPSAVDGSYLLRDVKNQYQSDEIACKTEFTDDL